MYRNMMFLIGLWFASPSKSVAQVDSTTKCYYSFFRDTTGNAAVVRGTLQVRPCPVRRVSVTRPRTSALRPDTNRSMGVRPLSLGRDTIYLPRTINIDLLAQQTARIVIASMARSDSIANAVAAARIEDQNRRFTRNNPGSQTEVRTRSSIARAAPVVGAIASLVTLGFVVANNCCNGRKLVVSYGLNHNF